MTTPAPLPDYLTPTMAYIAARPEQWHSRSTLLAAGIPNPNRISCYLGSAYALGSLTRRPHPSGNGFEYQFVRLPAPPAHMRAEAMRALQPQPLRVDLTLHKHPVVALLLANPGAAITLVDIRTHLAHLSDPDAAITYAVRRGYVTTHPGPLGWQAYRLRIVPESAADRRVAREHARQERQRVRAEQAATREERARLRQRTRNATRREMRATQREERQRRAAQKQEQLEQERRDRRAARAQATADRRAAAAELKRQERAARPAPTPKPRPERPELTPAQREARRAQQQAAREDRAAEARRTAAQKRLELSLQYIRQDTVTVRAALVTLGEPVSEKHLIPAAGLTRGRLQNALRAMTADGNVRVTPKYGGATYTLIDSGRTAVPAAWTSDARRVHEHLSTRAGDTVITMARELRLTREQIEGALDTLHALGQLTTRAVGHSFVFGTPPQEVRNAAD
ncbi:hypothetical protein ACMT4L_16800 [Deinococcus sp. A31D244]|uniref:hypothetical protein n=1 Tax=Deinococcus sp. A31D244 TaxID=3397675 RepID=UPI0039E07CE6